MEDGVSVIVCCYNSAGRIAETIHYLNEQRVPVNVSWEVLIVNNASTDDTKTIASQRWTNRSPNVSFSIVDEFIPGLASARKKGIEEAKYDVLVFCDDDNHLDSNYVYQAYELMKAKCDVGIMGGWVKPKLPVCPGSWIRDFYPALAIGKQAEQDGYVDWVFGAGMILRKEIFRKLKSHNIELMLSDRVGSRQTSGGDAEICMAARFSGYTIYYSKRLELDHQIAAHRLTKKSFIQANYRNVFPLVYLYLMETLMKNREASISRMYRVFLTKRISMILHFLPRWIVGKHRFYSFIILYQNLQLLLWLVTQRMRFYKTASEIKKNLYHAA